ncbi:Ig-like domain-containing protein [Shewanella fidelis]|uniref:Ig-like domain-containing protein n=1 Tax=Shewanella fidelis TaxID=173509 RepID=A0AAW8NNL5_9GAMM|nr:Ig-like domain-containing protein [Shewanella fidelis]MDR8523736.1 Ig-like domain-containing protein [Shewanella fidelis]MDW4810284.1 Ig-like domain-containing protein [Shewanella fidelis]MDW4814429.1 Ig-like domain-containing protein [Shewanella fidelis]MDW4818519.1 Ig-like domain-containing protein [Shewanella fidelis]MDW4823828.1 Ig-like domain-containing protein [Shewanella fidelis]
MKTLNIGRLTLFVSIALSGCGGSDSSTPPSENQPPIAIADKATVYLGTNEYIDVLENDSDPEGEELTLTTFSISEGTGSASVQDNKLLFIPEATGTTLISYTISDPKGTEAASLLTITVHDPMQVTADFVGSKTCVSCHSDKDTFFETGHNFKLNKVIDDKAPEYPFSNIDGAVELMFDATNSLGTPNSWEDISYVIGGYDTWANFLDKDGYILAGKGVAVSMPQNGDDISIKHIQGYQPDAAPDSQLFNCGLCHSTGWKDYTPDSDLNPHRQDNLKGFAGTFNQAGIQCEACHGAGSIHIKTQSSEHISRVAQGRSRADLTKDDMGYGLAITCSECHSKKTNRHYPDFVSEHNADFGGDTIGGRSIPYFDGGRLAGDQMLGLDANTGVATGKKREMACHTCHNPHRSKANEDQPGHEDAMVKNCIDCHGEKTFISGLEVHETKAKCTTCHMPKSNHFFKINLEFASDSPENFSEDRQYVQPWNVAKDSCGSCHDNYDELAATITVMHN